MYMRKAETASEYLERKLSKASRIQGTSDITRLKAEAMEHFSKMTPVERLAEAEFDCQYQRTTDKIGNLYYGGVRIWINREGKIWANRPKGKEYRY